MRLVVTGALARIENPEPLTSGRVGLMVGVEYDSLWNGLSKAIVFKDESGHEKVIINNGSEVEVAHEVLVSVGDIVRIGVFGYNDDPANVIIPTVYAVLGIVMEGADPDIDPSTNPTLPVWSQILEKIGNLDELDTEAKENLVAAINEAAQSGGGGGTSDHTRLANRDAENQHPMSAITGLEDALDGKQPSGEYLTPEDIEGLASEDYVDEGLAEKQDTISDLENIRSGAALGATALQTAPVGSVNGKTGAVNLVPADLGIGSVFNLKGSKPTYADLPSSGNVIGDVWYVVADSVGYIWLNDGTDDRWEQLGMEIDLSAYRTASAQDIIDSGKQDKITVLGLAKFDGNGGFSEAEADVDYQTPISWDDVPTEDSTNGITSGAVFAAIGDVESVLDSLNSRLEATL